MLATVHSILAQSLQDFELIIIDDASTDNSKEIIQTLERQHHNIHAIYLASNQGPGIARNQGIDQAKSKLITFIDADDLWHKDKLAIQYKTHTKKNCAISCTGFSIGKLDILTGNTSYKALLKNNVINTSSVMFDKTRITVQFPKDYPSEDYSVWLNIAKQTNIYFICKVLVYRKKLNGISSNKLKMAKTRWQIYTQIEKLNNFKAIYYMIRYASSGLTKYLKVYL